MPIVRHKSRSSLLPDYVDQTGTHDPETPEQRAEHLRLFPGLADPDPVERWHAELYLFHHQTKRPVPTPIVWRGPGGVIWRGCMAAQNSSVTK